MGLFPGLWDRPGVRSPSDPFPRVPPYTSFMTREQHADAALLTMAAALRTGTTTICSCDRYMPSTTVEAADRAGIRTFSGVMANDVRLRTVGRPNWPEAADELTALARARRSDPLRRFFIGAHSLYSCPPEQIVEARERARALDVPFNIHVAENEAELRFVRERYATTPVRALEGLGVLDDRVVADHVIYVDDEEIEILAARRVGVASCPLSTAKSGAVAPLARFVKRGLRVGLATDSLLSNNALSMLRELALAIVLQRVRGAGSSLGPRAAIRLATVGSAAVLGWDDEIGSLEVGKAADIVLYDLRHPWGLSAERVESEIVYAADRSSVRTVIVAGRTVLSDGRLRTIDEEQMWSDLTARHHAGGVREWEASP
jgi:5-methylthioadenosine/S-adenosylhomocysteine deaminase